MPRTSRSDLERIRRMPEEDIERAAEADPDARPMSDEELAEARPMRLEDYLPETKEKVCLRLDRDVLEWFRKRGRGYQTQINAALKAFIAAQPRSGGTRPPSGKNR